MSDVSNDHLYTLIVGAVRYALGRRSYVVSDTCDIVRAYWPDLATGQREVVARDVRERAANGSLGDPCDEREWRALMAWMEERP